MAVIKKVVEGEVLTKAQRIEVLRKAMDKDFGEGTMIGAKNKPRNHPAIPTGSIGLDKALGIGGLPRGRIVEIIGWESSGKTTIAIEVIASSHRSDPDSYCAIVDVEHAFDVKYAEGIGVDLNRLEICQPSYGEEALEVAERMCKSGNFDIIVVDSVAALVPKAEVERQMGESSMGKQAILLSQACRKLTPIVAESDVLFIMINQKREKIGIMFGDSSTTPGGNALKFYASVRLDVTRSTTEANSIKDGDEKVGNLTKVKVIKNKMAPPFKSCEFYIRYGEGIDKVDEIVENALDAGIINKSGTIFSYNGDKLSKGKPELYNILLDNPSLLEEIKEKTIEAWVPKEIPIEEVGILELMDAATKEFDTLLTDKTE